MTFFLWKSDNINIRKVWVKWLLLIAVLVCGLGSMFGVADEVSAGQTAENRESFVVVLDPGHGGSEDGGMYGELKEKDITLKTALAMKNELEKYEGITVYLTRDSDVDISLEERVNFAESVGADFFFCLHYNMSEFHTKYGAECWVSAYGDCYAKGYDFATIEMEMLTDLGLYNRGIKTKISATRDADYYGIIRRSTAIGMPSVIIEHCHLDHEMDAPFIDTDSWPQIYGVRDATAVAKYFGLRSKELGVDYGGSVYSVTETPSSPMYPDKSAPEQCTVTDIKIDEETKTIGIHFTASDAESRMLYYTWSTDNGETFADYKPWPENGTEVDFEIPIPKKGENRLIVRAVNLYELVTDSETVDLSELISEELFEENKTDADEATDADGDSGVANIAGADDISDVAEVAGDETIWVLEEDENRDEVSAGKTKRTAVIVAGAALLFAAWIGVILTLMYRQKRKISKKRCAVLLVGTTLAGILAIILLFFSGCGASMNGNNESELKSEQETGNGESGHDSVQAENSEEEQNGTGISSETAEVSEETFMEQNFYFTELSEELKNRITGVSYPDTTEDVAINYEELRYVHVLHYDFENEVQEGELICNQAIAEDLVEIFEELYRAEYPIEKIVLIDDYGGDDETSMEDNNTSCFNYRVVSGTDRLSNHAYGLAIDINPLYNPYVRGSGENVDVQPVNAEGYTDRDAAFEHKIDHDDLCYQLFTAHGFTWGGDWTNSKDYQHFEKKEV